MAFVVIASLKFRFQQAYMYRAALQLCAAFGNRYSFGRKILTSTNLGPKFVQTKFAQGGEISGDKIFKLEEIW